MHGKYEVSFPYHSTVISKVKVFYFHHSTFLLAVNSDELSSLFKLDCDVSAGS